MKIQIPEQHLPVFAEWLALSQGDQNRLVEALSAVPACSDREHFESAVRDELRRGGLETVSTGQIPELVLALAGGFAAGDEVDAAVFAKALSESADTALDPLALEKAVVSVLSVESVQLSAKAHASSLQLGRRIHELSITQHVQSFAEHSEPSLYVAHRLEIAHGREKEDGRLSVWLARSELEQLRMEIDQALGEEAKLEAKLPANVILKSEAKR